MAETEMTTEERDAFLSDVHIGILAIARDAKGPLALPIWYEYEDGDVIIGLDGDSLKATLLRKQGRATMTVQTETPPYQYVSVEGPVTIEASQRDVSTMAIRYLGHQLGTAYAEHNPTTDTSVIARLTPERWLTCDFGKAIG